MKINIRDAIDYQVKSWAKSQHIDKCWSYKVPELSKLNCRFASNFVTAKENQRKVFDGTKTLALL